MSTYTISTNPEFNSLEIHFPEKPAEQVISLLKSLRFRWHGIKKLWYGYADEQELTEAISSATNGEQAELITTGNAVPAIATTEKKEQVNQYGVKVGDLFSASWGYDQTNIDFFQVIALRGKQSVVVREVNLRTKTEKGISSMSRDVSFHTTSEILPPSKSSVFIKDNENGDIKRIKDLGSPGHPHILFSLSSYADAHPYHGEELYESWYA